MQCALFCVFTPFILRPVDRDRFLPAYYVYGAMSGVGFDAGCRKGKRGCFCWGEVRLTQSAPAVSKGGVATGLLALTPTWNVTVFFGKRALRYCTYPRPYLYDKLAREKKTDRRNNHGIRSLGQQWGNQSHNVRETRICSGD